MQESFAAKLEVIKENYFTKEEVVVEEVNCDDEPLELAEETEAPVDARYVCLLECHFKKH